jgi:hypothetical protein
MSPLCSHLFGEFNIDIIDTYLHYHILLLFRVFLLYGFQLYYTSHGLIEVIEANFWVKLRRIGQF